MKMNLFCKKHKSFPLELKLLFLLLIKPINLSNIVYIFVLNKILKFSDCICFNLLFTWRRAIYYSWISDQRRQAAKKDGCLCCIVHNNFKPEQTTKKSVLNVIFGKVGNILTYTVVQVSVILLTVVFFAIGLWGMLSLTQVTLGLKVKRVAHLSMQEDPWSKMHVRFFSWHMKVKVHHMADGQLAQKQAENGLQSRSSENGKTAVWHYGLKLQW